MSDEEQDFDPSQPIEVPLTQELDLHAFPPREVRELVEHYLEECLARGWEEVRIVHGKGTGALRERVHAILARHPGVVDYRLGGTGRGSWGATVVRLRRESNAP